LSAPHTPSGARRSSPSLWRRPGSIVTAAELDRLCLDHIAHFKRPRRYVFLDELPKNNYGKILKTDLRRRLAQERN